jgi:phenylpropionate dioxygenase-like ring-hydroxylating dioxygenase large terminal subunit
MRAILLIALLPLSTCFSPLSFRQQRQPHSHVTLQVSTRATNKVAIAGIKNTTDTPTSTDTADEIIDSQIRPLHQHWWSVSLVSALDATRPQAIQVLGQRLVLIHSAGQWTAMDDRCSHRFAPLSEGRIVPASSESNTNCIQCAYHGWEFDTSGTCTKLPQQQEAVSKANKVQVYPTREQVGIVWVWMDPTSPASLVESAYASLPISPLLKRMYNKFGMSCLYQRDLPYGMEVSNDGYVL